MGTKTTARTKTCPYCNGPLAADRNCADPVCRSRPGPSASAVNDALRGLRMDRAFAAQIGRALGEMEQRDEAVLRAMPAPAECQTCLGSGRIAEDDGSRRKCLDCRGTGER